MISNNNYNKRSSVDTSLFDTSILRKKSSDDTINSSKSASSPININKRVSIDRNSLDASLLRCKSSDDSIHSLKGMTSPISCNSFKLKKKKILFSSDYNNDNDFDFEYY